MEINEKVKEFLIANRQEEYRKFSLSLLPPGTKMLGVRLPLIKKFSKELCCGNWRNYLKNAESKWYEEVMLQGFVVGMAKCGIDERIAHIKEFLPKISNWGICGSFSMGVKIFGPERGKYFEYIKICQHSSAPYIRRYATVSMLSKYVDEEYIRRVLELLMIEQPDNYYVKMATAWALSICLVKHKKTTESEILKRGLDSDTLKMTLRKVKESRRFGLREKREIVDVLKKAYI